MNPAKKTDFLALGSGLAGLTFALRVAEHGAVAVLTKGEVTDSNTSWAQGGIAAAIGEADSWESHERDTLISRFMAGISGPNFNDIFSGTAGGFRAGAGWDYPSGVGTPNGTAGF